jgi:dTDP-4-amino-4,6-dideoxygalactose transaminase
MKFKVKYVDLYKEYQSQEKKYKNIIDKVFKSSSFILRDEVFKFEKKITKFLGVKYCVGLNSGTDALLMALSQINLKKGDEVITVSHTYVATISAIVHVGAKPIYIDISDDFNIDANQIEKKITKKTKAILVVHLNGRSCDMKKICKIAKKYKIHIIEDSAQSLGSKFKNKHCGTFGTAAAFSLHPMKSLNVPGDGGFLVTDNKKIFENVSLLRDHGRSPKNKNLKKCFGFNSRLDNLHAALAVQKLKKLNKWIGIRRKIAKTYINGLKNINGLILPDFKNKNYFDTFNSFVIRSNKRDQLKKFLLKKGIEVFSHLDKGVHLEKFSPKSNSKLLKTIKIEKQILSIPIYPELDFNSIKYVILNIKKFYGQK